MKPNQRSAILFAVLLFGCGMVSGILAQRYFAANVVSAKTAENFRHQYVSEMRRKLSLSGDQAKQLEVILDETKAQYKAVRDQYRPEMLKVKNEQISRVKSMLTPEQIPAYERLVQDRERRAREQDERERQEDFKRRAAHQAEAGR